MSTVNRSGRLTPGDLGVPYPRVLTQAGQVLTARQARAQAIAWVEASLPEWPGIIGAHFVGGITSMPDGAPDIPSPPTTTANPRKDLTASSSTSAAAGAPIRPTVSCGPR